MAYRPIRRRDLLKITVVSALAPAVPLAGCASSENTPAPEPGPSDNPKDAAKVFPQGLMSGDPRPDSIVLWTRVEPTAKNGKATATLKVGWEIATDDGFEKLVTHGSINATSDTDHTIRLKVTDLAPGKVYYYRFTALDVHSMTGRTKTAPKDDADVPVRFAFAACQDFVGRFYHSWKALAAEDAVDFVVFLGDYIYETDGDPSFQTPGEGRAIVLPDGVMINDSTKAASTLADYRSLYRQFRSDPDLQEVQRLFPFVCIWDDHEFGDDCWQDHNTHFNGTKGDEQNAQQRQDADQAWFEYQPADVPWDGTKAYPDDIKIYRTLRYGKHMELFLTDERFYRDRALIPEGPADLSVAKLSANSKVGSHIFLLKSGFDPQEAAAKPTMLGADQKSWFVDAVKGSKATWKLWGNEVQLAQMVVNLKPFDKVPPPFNDKFYLTVDQWDGFRSERQEILTALSGVTNLVAITGDIHAFYAAELHPDFDAPGPKPVGVEYVTAGISSQAIAPAASSVLSDPTYQSLGLLDLIPMWDTLLLHDSPHYRYGNSFVNGVSVCDLSADKIEVEYLIIKDVQNPDFDPSTVERARFRTMAGSSTIETL
jgi:alkaline phosphatase D